MRWATLVIILSTLPLAVARQDGKLAVTNERVTYGILGQERKGAKLLAGDRYVVTYDIENLRVRDDGRVMYSMGMELVNKEGKSQFKKDPADLEAVNALGGTRLPAFAQVEIGTDTPPGEYALTVTITDRASKETAQLVKKFEVLPKTFGFAQVALTNEQGLPLPPTGVVGQSYGVNFALVGFDLDAKTMQPNLAVEMRVLEDGKQTLAKPFTGEAQAVPEAYRKLVPMGFTLPLNRPGKFTVQLKATDNLSKKTADQTLNITVLDNK